MARALIVGCGCRGRSLAAELSAAEWTVRGTSRSAEGVAAIEAAGFEAVRADPDQVATLLDHVADVAVVCWLMGSASGDAESVAALNGPRLERVLEELVDTPVRGFVYEAAGTVDGDALRAGSQIVASAAERWRIPVVSIDADPADHDGWTLAAYTAVHETLDG